MSDNSIADLLRSVEGVLVRFTEGANWIERRDAADAATLVAREILAMVRRGAEDKDPDVSHACQDALKTLEADKSADAGSLANDIAYQRRTLLGQFGQGGAAPQGDSAGAAGHAPEREEIGKWALALAGPQKGQCEPTDKGFNLTLPMQQGRTQKVLIDLTTKDSSGEGLILMFTRCGKPDPRVFERVLQANAKLSHAAFALIPNPAGSELMLLSRRRLAGLTEAEFMHDATYLAHKGDKAESQIHDADVY